MMAPVTLSTMVGHEAGSGAPRAFHALAWTVLGATVAVIISGDIVQATESGAGCGENWPRCDGALLPAFDDAATGIEFAHRVLTFVLSLLVIWLFTLARRTFAAGHRIRRAVNYVVVFFVLEILIGALLVVFGWVEQDASVGRVVADSLHVVNTFFLIGVLAFVVHHVSGGRLIRLMPAARPERLVLAGMAILVIIGVTGAVSSLADTLFPAETVLDGLREEFGPTAPFLLRFRVVHPVVAIVGGTAMFVIIGRLVAAFPGPNAGLGRRVQVIIGAQFGFGILNLALLTPLETQIIHLLMAELLWITFLMFSWRLFDGADVEMPDHREHVGGSAS